MMESKIGFSWRQLELRGQQNSAKSKQIFGPYSSSPHTFVVEQPNDGNSLLRFMKVVVPEYRELIPPPRLSVGFRPAQCRLSARMQSTESIAGPAPRQLRQNTETTMALNAFSDLEAIAEMGAGNDDTESQQSETANRPPSKLTGRCSPSPGNSLSSLAQQSLTGANSEQSGSPQMSMEQQQRQRFGMNVVYRQQPPKQPMAPMGSINPTTGRLIMDNQPALRHSSSSDVFNFVPDHSPFEDIPNFGNVSTTPYQSPTGVSRRRGRGRRAGNFGDRHPSTSSSIEHEGTPESPSEFVTLRKTRGTGNSGQRRPRKPRKPANMSFDQQEGIPRPQFQLDAHQTMGQIPPLPATPSNYISPQIEEDFRSKMMSVYEMGICESSTDDEEMDPPPPPKELMAHKQSEISLGEQPAPETYERTDVHDESGANLTKKEKDVPPLAKCSVSSSQSSGGDQTADAVAEPSQNTPVLQDIKLVSAAPSSASSSPAFSQLSEQSDYRGPAAAIVKTDLDANPKKATVESAVKTAGLNDNEIEGPNSKKREAEMDRLKPSKDAQTHPNKLLSDRMPKEHFVKKESVDSTTKRPALVLKIKKDGGASSAASTKHSSSSSSPSSTSSCTAAPPTLPGPTPQQQPNEPVARLSSSAAPPSKYKQQRQQTKRPVGKDETGAAPPTKKKQRKTIDMEGRPSSPPPAQQQQQQHRPSTSSSSISNTATTKWVKEGSTTSKNGSSATLKKESALPNVMSQIAVPFPNLKNFKIPKVIENADPPPSTSTAPPFVSNKGGPAEHQQQCNQTGGAPSSDKSSRNKFGPFKSSDHFEHRRPGGGPKQTIKGAGHPNTHYHQYNDKFAPGGGNSFQAHNAYNRQRAPKQSQGGGGGRHGGGSSELPRKQHGAAPSRPMISSAAGHRFTVQFQQHSRDGGPTHSQHHPVPPQLQHFPAQQSGNSSVGWQAVQQTAGEFFQQQHQNNSYLPQQQHQRLEWFGQINVQTEQRQSAGHPSATVRLNQTRATDRQSGSNCREEDRMDNSPSAGNGLQIVDDE